MVRKISFLEKCAISYIDECNKKKELKTAFNKCEMTGKLKEIYCENGLVTIKILWDKNNTIFNAIRYKNEDVILKIKGV